MVSKTECVFRLEFISYDLEIDVIVKAGNECVGERVANIRIGRTQSPDVPIRRRILRNGCVVQRERRGSTIDDQNFERGGCFVVDTECVGPGDFVRGSRPIAEIENIDDSFVNAISLKSPKSLTQRS